MSVLASIRHLSVVLDDRQVVDDLSFDIHEKECVVVIGPNGSGKTVLLKAMLGMLPYSGEIAWAPGVKVGYVPQKIDADRSLPLTTLDLLLVKARILGLPRSSLEEVVRTVEIKPEVLEMQLGRLSGGQFQKALIGFALLGHPNLLLFDEPTASLDQLAEEHVYELIEDLQSHASMSIIIVSHDLSVVYRYADKVLCLNHRGIGFGPPATALTPEALRALYGGQHTARTHAHLRSP